MFAILKSTGMNISALCTDVDGTLLNSNRELSDKTISVFRSVAEMMPVILASSRMPAAMTHLQAELGILQYPMICYNGGYVLQYGKSGEIKKVFDSVVIPLQVCEAVVNLAKHTSVNVSLYFEDDWYAPQFDYWTDREQTVTKVDPIIKSSQEVLNLWKKNGNGAHKIMCMGTENEINALEKKLTLDYGHLIHVYFSRATYLELAPRSISKASALRKVLADAYDIPMSSVMAFGDNFNDVEMLAQSGFGVAVANGREQAKFAAKEVTLKSTEDGVAISIEKYILNASV
jgi:Cof subfamily protein (haloacid dehalogenase superfamily)